LYSFKQGDLLLCIKDNNWYKKDIVYTFFRYNKYDKDILYTEDINSCYGYTDCFKFIERKTPKGNKEIKI